MCSRYASFTRVAYRFSNGNKYIDCIAVGGTDETDQEDASAKAQAEADTEQGMRLMHHQELKCFSVLC